MRIQVLSFILTLVTVLSARAANQTATISSGLSGGSAENRVGKSMMLTAQLAGASATDASALPATLTQGLNLGFYLTSDAILSIGVESGHGAVGDWLFGSGNQVADTRALSASLKKFVGNSFYLRGGAEYRQVKYRQHDEDWLILSSTSTRNKSDLSFDGNMTSVTFSIGNQWQFSGFTIGADWAGVTMPLASSLKSETASVTGTVSSSDQQQYDDAKNSLKVAHYEFCRFYLGASF